jgi:hypothetical protein
VKLGDVSVTRFIVGGNPFSGFSHQGPDRSAEMMGYYTVARIKDALRKAEAAGINTCFARTDRHIRRLIREYRDEGGTIQWIGQTASELADQPGTIRAAAAEGAVGVYLHGGLTDHWYAEKKFDCFHAVLDTMRECGVAAGFAGHNPDAHRWMSDHLDLDFHMCSYYDPSPRAASPHHDASADEKWDPADRDHMAALIKTLPRPAVHYKVLAGGNRPADEAFRFLARSMREKDAVCIGHYLKDRPNLIAENVSMFGRVVEGAD